MYWDKRATKLDKKCLLHVKYALTLPWEIWGDRFNSQYSTHMYILIHHRIATCIKLYHLYITCCQYPPVMSRNRENASKTSEQSESRVYWTCGWRRGACVYVFAFVLETDISSIRCKDDATYYTFNDFLHNNCHSCLWLFDDSLKCTCKYCVDGSICHFKFPKVVLAHILCEVGTFYIVL